MIAVGSKVCLLARVAEAEGRDSDLQYTVLGLADKVSAELEGLGWRQCDDLCPAPDLERGRGLAYWETH